MTLVNNVTVKNADLVIKDERFENAYLFGDGKGKVFGFRYDEVEGLYYACVKIGTNKQIESNWFRNLMVTIGNCLLGDPPRRRNDDFIEIVMSDDVVIDVIEYLMEDR